MSIATTSLEAALTYAEKGWPLLPVYEVADGCCACGQATSATGHKPGKHPRTSHGVADASVDEACVREWWRRYPNAAVGIATGRESGLVVLDVDPRNGGEESLARLQGVQGKLPSTLAVRTGGGGTHYFFRHPRDRIVPNRAPLSGFPGLDLKGDGGYVVAPPSRHVSGARYEWLEPRQEIADAPAWLLELAGEKRLVGRVEYAPGVDSSTLPPRVAALLAADGRIRSRFERSPEGLSDQTPSGVDCSLAVLLAHHGFAGDVIEAAVRCSRRKEGLDDKPASYFEATIGKALAVAQAALPETPQKHVGVAPRPVVPGPRLVSLQELLDEPEEETPWVVEGLLPASGLSLVVGKPKVGKSTFARWMALAVAQGKPFLGLAVAQGPVIYLALEEKRGEVKRHLREMGASGPEPLHFLLEAAPEAAMAWLDREVRARKPVLIVIDTMQRFLRLSDLNEYAQVTNAIDPVLALARDTDAHVMLVHHARKGSGGRKGASGGDFDSILGSTAIQGSVDTTIMLDQNGRNRAVESRQRYGADMPRTPIALDDTTGIPCLETAPTTAAGYAERILKFIDDCDGSPTADEVVLGIGGNRAAVKQALARLAEPGGPLERTGTGKRGNAYRYERRPTGALP